MTLGDLVAGRARTRGDAEALITESRRITYRDLHLEARRAARAMTAMGLRHGDYVAIMLGNDEHWVSLFAGCAMIGAVAVPVNTRFKAAELAFCLEQAKVKALFLADHFLKIDFIKILSEAVPAVHTCLPGEALPTLTDVVVIGDTVPHACRRFGDVLAAGDRLENWSAPDVRPDDILLIQFTSGSTAYPKGVMLTHDNVVRNAAASGERIGIRAEDSYFNCRPFFHVGGSTLSLVVSIFAGSRLVTLPTFEAGAALRLMARERCALTSGNDTIFQMLMAHPDFDRTKLHLRGGWAAAGPETMRQIAEVMGAREVCWAYGLSEASPNVVMGDWRDPLEVRIADGAKPHDGIDVRTVDPTSGAVLPSSASGEIQVRGWSVMRGYCNNPAETAKAFTPDGWLRTGDIGVVDADGRLKMAGRLKEMFRVGGENVAPAEVEEILQAHPAVATAQVCGVPDPRMGEVAAAFVTLNPGFAPGEAELVDWMKGRCANFRVPRYLRIVRDFEAIGMTASGKVQKAKLRAHAIEVFGLGG